MNAPRAPRARGNGPERVARWAALAAAGLLLLACGPASETDEQAAAHTAAASDQPFEWSEGQHPEVTLHIEGHGDITLALYPELAPKTVDNFIGLAESGFYDGTHFHRVIPDFMIQGGDPNSKDDDPKNDGNGGPGYTIPDEPNAAPHERGAIGMANTGRRNSGGSQFFIVHQDAPHLDGHHTVFGRVVVGLDVVDSIASVETDEHGRWGSQHRPLNRIVVSHTTVRNVGEAPRDLAATQARAQD